MKIVLFSGHLLCSKRKAGFHHLAEAFVRNGHEVVFVTVGFSLISYIKKDFRVSESRSYEKNTLIEFGERKKGYIFFSLFHPHSLVIPLLNNILSVLVKNYGKNLSCCLSNEVKHADIVVYESCSALYFVKTCKELAGQASHIYRVSDHLEMMRSTLPDLLRIEKNVALLFDLISVPYRSLYKKFQWTKKTVHQNHGIRKDIFDQNLPSPYKTLKNCVYVGVGFFDFDFVEKAALACPDINFHYIGPLERVFQAPNVYWYGELPFEDTVPFIKHADVGLQVLEGEKVHLFEYTLKVVQYRYCGLPVVCAGNTGLSGEGFFFYSKCEEDSIKSALYAALASGKSSERARNIIGWEDIAKSFIGLGVRQKC